ncbi:MAG: hypothetical protein ACPGED_05270 [Flavobacteriales bacterium]
MNRYIKNFSSLTDDDKLLIRKQYPFGFSGKDYSQVKTNNGEVLNVLEVHTPESIYLVRVNHELLERVDELDQQEPV